MAGKLEACTEEGDLIVIEGATGWMALPGADITST
jgi:hypothetical protein